MVGSNALNLHVEYLRTETTGTKQIPISHIYDLDERKSKEILVDENLLQVCSTNEDESESVIVDESSTEESK